MNLQFSKQPFHPDLTVPPHNYLGVHLSIEFNLIVQLHSIGILAAEETMELRKCGRLSMWALREGKDSWKPGPSERKAIT